MRRLGMLLAVAGALTGVGASSTQAAPTDARVSVASQAEFVTPTTVAVKVTYVCPSSFVAGNIFLRITQEETGGNGVTPLSQVVPCTDEPETVVVTVVGGPFTVGQAIVFANLFGLFTGETDQRRIQIVL